MSYISSKAHWPVVILSTLPFVASNGSGPEWASTPPMDSLASFSVMRIEDGEVAYSSYHGFRKIGPATSRAVNEHTLFRIASISKLVTAIGFMRLVESGRVSLDDDVSAHLGFRIRHPDFPEVAITPAMLLSHTSGIRDGKVYAMPPDQPLQAFFEPGSPWYEDGAHFADDEAGEPRAPGEWFEYANLNFGVLATMMENLSGQRFDRYMHDHVLAPLEIEGGFNLRLLSDDALDNLAVMYRNVDGRFVPQADNIDGRRPDATPASLSDYVIGRNGTVFSPQGGLRISLHGLARIARLMMGRGRLGEVRLLQAETVELMEAPRWTFSPAAPNGDTYGGIFQQFGLSMQRFLGRQNDAGGDLPFADYQPVLMGHLGEAYGLLSGVLYDPKSKDAYLYIINGTPPELDSCPGTYSSFYCWEEVVLSALSQKQK